MFHTALTLITTSNAAYGTLQGAMLVSLARVAIGFAVGGAAGLVLGVVAGLSRLGENSVDPLMQMLRTLPLFGLIPVFIVWFGIGQLPKILLIALGASIPLYLNTFSGIRNVDAKLAEAGQSLGCTAARRSGTSSCRAPCRRSWSASGRASASHGWPWWSRSRSTPTPGSATSSTRARPS